MIFEWYTFDGSRFLWGFQCPVFFQVNPIFLQDFLRSLSLDEPGMMSRYRPGFQEWVALQFQKVQDAMVEASNHLNPLGVWWNSHGIPMEGFPWRGTTLASAGRKRSTPRDGWGDGVLLLVRWFRMPIDCHRFPDMVNCHTTNWKITIFHGKIDYFNGHFQ